jgi:hypothetical protein
MDNNLKWTAQKISLTFIEEHPNLYLNPSKIKQHLKHLQLKQKKMMILTWILLGMKTPMIQLIIYKYKSLNFKKFDLGQSFDLNWWDHITNDKPNMKFVSMLNKI